MVLADSTIGLDGATGQPRWAGQISLPSTNQLRQDLLDPGDPTRLPLLIANNSGTTVCRTALSTTPQGAYAPPRGLTVPAGLACNDPRRSRSLPWSVWLVGALGPLGWSAAVGLALVNVILPLALVRLAASRRRWSIRTLMALPVAVAVPLSAYQIIEPLLPEHPDAMISSPPHLFVIATLAGTPIVACMMLVGWSMIRRRWQPLAMLAGLTILASLAIAAVWLWFDMRTMSAIEHFTRSGWYLVVLPGAYAAGTLLVMAWVILACTRAAREPNAFDAGARQRRCGLLYFAPCRVSHCTVGYAHRREPRRLGTVGVALGRCKDRADGVEKSNANGAVLLRECERWRLFPPPCRGPRSFYPWPAEGGAPCGFSSRPPCWRLL